MELDNEQIAAHDRSLRRGHFGLRNAFARFTEQLNLKNPIVDAIAVGCAETAMWACAIDEQWRRFEPNAYVARRNADPDGEIMTPLKWARNHTPLPLARRLVARTPHQQRIPPHRGEYRVRLRQVVVNTCSDPDDGCYIVHWADDTAINTWGADLKDCRVQLPRSSRRAVRHPNRGRRCHPRHHSQTRRLNIDGRSP